MKNFKLSKLYIVVKLSKNRINIKTKIILKKKLIRSNFSFLNLWFFLSVVVKIVVEICKQTTAPSYFAFAIKCQTAALT